MNSVLRGISSCGWWGDHLPASHLFICIIVTQKNLHQMNQDFDQELSDNMSNQDSRDVAIV